MKIETLTIQNFRCFGPEGVTIALQKGLTALVGNNGSGKTAIFQALSKLFGVSAAQRRVTKSDFHVAADAEDIASGSKLVIECLFSFPELSADEDDASVPDVFYHMSASDEGAPLMARVRLEATWEEDLTPEGTVTEEFRWIKSLDENFDWEAAPKVSAVDRSLVQLVYVPASRNAFDQVTALLKSRLKPKF